MTDAPFKSSHQAITFALNFSKSLYDAPVMNKMAQGPAPAGRGLGGLSGAGQAGMILSRLYSLPTLQSNVIVARLAPRWFDFEGPIVRKEGKRVNQDWQDAVKLLIEASSFVSDASLNLREALVIKYAGGKIKLAEIADHTGLHRNTVSKHNAIIAGMLRREESKAWDAIETNFIDCGIVASGA